MAVVHAQKEVIQFLLENSSQIDLDVRAESGNTALHAAVTTGDVEIVEMLVEAGADITAVNPEAGDATPLHMAIVHEHDDIAVQRPPSSDPNCSRTHGGCVSSRCWQSSPNTPPINPCN